MKAEMSDPENLLSSEPYPSVFRASDFISSGFRSCFCLLRALVSIPSRASASGREMYILFWNLLLIPASSPQGKFVAPRTRILPSLFPTPCICTRNSVLTLLLDSSSLSVRLETKESISSMKMIEGCGQAEKYLVFLCQLE